MSLIKNKFSQIDLYFSIVILNLQQIRNLMKNSNNYYNNQISLQILAKKAFYWNIILKTYQIENQQVRNQSQIQNVEKNLKNQRVINMDVTRTRVNFLQPEILEGLQKCLTLFCKKNNIIYKQGMNQIMAPFIVFKKCSHLTLKQTYNYFSKFFKKFLLNLYFDDEFNSLEFLFKLIAIIIKYHDPALARYLAENQMLPQLYATPWFMTLFSNKLSLEMIYLFWEIYMIEDDEFLIFYLVVGIILYNRNKIFQTKQNDLPQTITQSRFNSAQQLIEIFKIALLIRKSTPKSLVLFSRENKVFEICESYKNVKKILDQIEKINLIIILPKQFVFSLYSKKRCFIKECGGDCYFCRINKEINFQAYDEFIDKTPYLKTMVDISNDIRKINHFVQFLVLDIRVFKTKHLIDSYIINIKDPIEKIEEIFINSYLEERGKLHFVFLMTQFEFQNLTKCDPEELNFCRKFIAILYSSGFQHISILEGGAVGLQKQLRLYIIQQQNNNQKIESLPKKQQNLEKIIQQNLELWNLQNHYYYEHGILNSIKLNIKPSLLYKFEKLSDINTKFVLGTQKIIFITEKFFIFFKNNELLRSIIIHLGNSKSLTQYFLSTGKFQKSQHQIFQIESLFFLKDLEKISENKSKTILYLYFKIYKLSEHYKQFCKHLKNLQTQDIISYLLDIKNQVLFPIYKEVENKQSKQIKLKIQCDPSYVKQCLQYSIGCFQNTLNQYTQFKKKLNKEKKEDI